MKEKTFTKSREFEIIIRGNYSTCNCLEEELYEISPEEISEYLIDNIRDFLTIENLKLSEQKIKED